MNKIKLKYRSWYKGQPPRRIKLQIPGWAGDSHDHCNGSKPQPWHCVPFVEGSTYGLELIYPFETECLVTNKNGIAHFEGDFKKEQEQCGLELPPFMSFAPGHYGFTSSLDIQTEPDYVIRLEPHPRFYTDQIGNVPLAIAGNIQTAWWPRVFFVVFKNPWPGQTHIFRQGEPYAKILVLPKKAEYQIEEMTEQEKKVRIERDNIINSMGRDFIAKKPWKDYLGHKFDDKYRVLANTYTKYGEEGVDKLCQEAKESHQSQKLAEETSRRKKIKRRLVKSESLLQNKKDKD